METKQEKIAIQKLALLYFLQNAEARVSEQRLNEANAALELMDYFNLQTNLHDMIENRLLLRQEAVNGRFYSITDVGLTTLRFFESDLLHSVRQKIEAYIEKHKEQMRLEASVYAEYVRMADNQFKIRLQIIENDVSVFEINFFAQTHAEADNFVQAWRKNAFAVYSQLFEALLTTPDQETKVY